MQEEGKGACEASNAVKNSDIEQHDLPVSASSTRVTTRHLESRAMWLVEGEGTAIESVHVPCRRWEEKSTVNWRGRGGGERRQLNQKGSEGGPSPAGVRA